jgi:nucleoside-diphosphate kinase
MTQRTLVLVKPDGVRRGLTGEVLRRIEAKGYRLVAIELRSATAELLAAHYAEHEGKPFYEPLVEFMLSGPVVALVAEGERCIEGFRSLAGATDPTVAPPGTIRGDLGRDWGAPVTRTSCTARTRRSRPSARSPSGSPSSRPDASSLAVRPTSEAREPAPASEASNPAPPRARGVVRRTRACPARNGGARSLR